MNVFNQEAKKLAMSAILSDESLNSVQKFSKLIVILQGDESNSAFADRLKVTHSTIGRWRDGNIGELTESLYYKISPLTEYSPGELMEMMHGVKPKIRQIKTCQEAIELLKALPEVESVELCNQVMKKLPKYYKAFFIAKIAQEIVEK